jgi:hypothetical protein
MKMQPVSQKQDAARTLPDWFKPSGFGARVQQGGSVPVGGKPANPFADLVAIEGRVEPDPPAPRPFESVLGVVLGCTSPRPRVGGAGIEIEWTERIDNPAWRNPDCELPIVA